MFLAGLLTCSMLLALVAPQTSLKSNFGVTLEGPVAEIIVRNWGALVGLIGIMLIYGAFVASVRRFCVCIAAISKATFIILVLLSGKQYLGFGVGTAIIVDSIAVVLFIAYLLISSLPKYKVTS